ncbi:MAG: hypothetical protein RL297_1902 [Pseudomonadota bacterium]
MPLEDWMAAIIDYRGKTPEKTSSGIPLVTAKIVKGGRIEDPEEFIAEDAYEQWMRRGIPEAGDVVLTTEAPLGEVAQLDGRRVALAQRIITLRGKPGLLDNTYLKFALQSQPIQEQLHGRASGSTVTGIKQSELRKLQLTFPALEEQQRVARVLGSLDGKIAVNRRINQTLEAMAQAIFKSWFVDFDPVKAKIAANAEGRDPLRAVMTAISGKPDAELDTLPPDQFTPLAATAALFPDEMEDSELGEIPNGWSAAPFGSMLTHTIGGDWGGDAPDATNDTRVAIIRGTDLPDLDQAQTNRVPVRYTTQKKLASRRMQFGDIVLEVSGGSRDQPTGRSFRLTANAMNEFDCPVEPASFCRLLRPVSPEIGVILGLHLSHIYQQGKTWEYQNQSTGIANFQTAHFLEAELVVRPPKAVADAFFKMVNPILERRHDPQGRRLAELRDALLPKLLSGELRVNSTEVEVTA